MASGLWSSSAFQGFVHLHTWAGIRSLAASARLGHTVAKVHTACSTSPRDGLQITYSGLVEQV